jgi:O-antigen/teichoic acid export membrane protein
MGGEQGSIAESDEAHGRTRDRAVMSAAGAAILSRLVMAGTMIGTLAIAARALSPTELGVVVVLTMLAVFLGFGDFGLGSVLMTRLPAVHARGDADGARALVGTMLSTVSGLGVLFLAVGVASAYLLPWQSLLGAEQLPPSTVRTAVLIVIACGSLSIPASLGARVLAGMQRGYVVHLWHMVSGTAGMLLVGACSFFGAPTWTYVLAIAGTPVVFAVIQTAWVLGWRFPQLRPHSLAVALPTALALVRSGGWFAILSICTVISYNIDSLVVSSILGAEDAAVFAIAARMFILTGSTLSLAGQQMWPALADAIHRGHVSWARSRYRRTLLLSTSINAVGCLVLVLLGQQIAVIWVGEALKPPMSLLIVLGVYTVISTCVAQSGYLLAAVEQVRTLAILGLGMTVLNVALSIALTQYFGITGPILGSLAALLLVLVGPVVYLTRREFKRLDVGGVPEPVTQERPTR